MKRIIGLLLVVTLIASCGLLVGCGTKKDVKEVDKAVSKAEKTAKEIATKAEEVSKLLESGKQEVSKGLNQAKKTYEDTSKKLSKKAPKKPTVHGSGIAGVWEYNQKEYPLPGIYTFKKDGTGKYNLAGQIQKLKWKTKGSKIIIRFEGTDADMTQKYKLDGDVLTLYDITDSPVVYYRVG